MPGAQPAAADRHDDLGEVGHVLEQLEPERALARRRRRGRRTGARTRARPRRARASAASMHSSTRVAADVDVAPWPRAASTLAIGASVGHEDLAGHAARARGGGERLRVVARRRRDDAARAAVLAERGELGRHAADLERARALEVLGLQRDDAAGALGDRARGEHRRAPGDRLDRGPRRARRRRR